MHRIKNGHRDGQNTECDMLKQFIHWLRDVPVRDEIDRRNAPAMQVLMMFYGTLIPLHWLWRVANVGLGNAAYVRSLALSLVIAVVAWASLFLIRRGQFRRAIVQFIALHVVFLTFVFATAGTRYQFFLYDSAPTMIPLLVGGLVLGRRALWSTYALLMLGFAIGFLTDLRTGIPPRNVGITASSVLISYLMITTVIDRTLNALRETLDESNSRGVQLRREMVERERAQSQLVHAQKMEAAGRLANGVAHDFNNVLGVILGFTAQRHGAMDDRDAGKANAQLNEALEGVEEAAGHARALVRKLLSFSRNDGLRIETFDAIQALSQMKPMLRQMFPSGVVLELPPSSEPLPVHLDRSEFELMVLNIAANARDAMGEQGRFRVSAVAAPGDIIEIALSDDGAGMDDATRKRIFEPFFSTKPAGDGTGLGLSVVHDLVKAVGGDIHVHSWQGRGSTFVIRLPSAEAAQAA